MPKHMECRKIKGYVTTEVPLTHNRYKYNLVYTEKTVS